MHVLAREPRMRRAVAWVPSNGHDAVVDERESGGGNERMSYSSSGGSTRSTSTYDILASSGDACR